MTPYQQGFLTKCAEHGLDRELAFGLLKIALVKNDPWKNQQPSTPAGFGQQSNTADSYQVRPEFNKKFFVSGYNEGAAMGSSTSGNGQPARFKPSFTPIAVKEDGTVTDNITDDKRMDGVNGMTYREHTVDPTVKNPDPRQPGMYRDGVRVRDRYGSFTYDYYNNQRQKEQQDWDRRKDEANRGGMTNEDFNDFLSWSNLSKDQYEGMSTEDRQGYLNAYRPGAGDMLGGDPYNGGLSNNDFNDFLSWSAMSRADYDKLSTEDKQGYLNAYRPGAGNWSPQTPLGQRPLDWSPRERGGTYGQWQMPFQRQSWVMEEPPDPDNMNYDMKSDYIAARMKRDAWERQQRAAQLSDTNEVSDARVAQQGS